MAIINNQLKEIKGINKLIEIDAPLRLIVINVAKIIPLQIITGYRNQVDQDKAFSEGKSQVRYPNGAHNSNPAKAVDIAPLPLDWNDTLKFYYFAGIVLGVAAQLGIKLRWGGDWNTNHDFKDNTLQDLVHFELI
jgi:hypothetical protein